MYTPKVTDMTLHVIMKLFIMVHMMVVIDYHILL